MKPYISPVNKTLSFPLTATIVYWLLLEHLQASDVWYGVFYAFFAIYWLVVVISLINDAVKGRKKAIINENGSIDVK